MILYVYMNDLEYYLCTGEERDYRRPAAGRTFSGFFLFAGFGFGFVDLLYFPVVVLLFQKRRMYIWYCLLGANQSSFQHKRFPQKCPHTIEFLFTI